MLVIKQKELHALKSITSFISSVKLRSFLPITLFSKQISALWTTSLIMWMTHSTNVTRRDTCWIVPALVRAGAGGSVTPLVSSLMLLEGFGHQTSQHVSDKEAYSIFHDWTWLQTCISGLQRALQSLLQSWTNLDIDSHLFLLNLVAEAVFWLNGISSLVLNHKDNPCCERGLSFCWPCNHTGNWLCQ